MSENAILELAGVSVGYGPARVLHGVDLAIAAGRLTAIVGPSGSGKTTLLRALNLLDTQRDGYWREGAIRFHGNDVAGADVDPNELRQRIGMVFQKPVVFPASISANVLFGVRHLGTAPRAAWPGLVEETLKRAALWDEVKDRLEEPARRLSQGQQQRLCIARALAVRPEVLLMDEPTASLDPRSTELVEAAIAALLKDATVILVTHHLAQARRLSHQVVLLGGGRVIEAGAPADLFDNPRTEEARRYLRLTEQTVTSG